MATLCDALANARVKIPCENCFNWETGLRDTNKGTCRFSGSGHRYQEVAVNFGDRRQFRCRFVSIAFWAFF